MKPAGCSSLAGRSMVSEGSSTGPDSQEATEGTEDACGFPQEETEGAEAEVAIRSILQKARMQNAVLLATGRNL